MDIDRELLGRFEAGLDPQCPERSAIPVAIVGYGEQTVILQIGDDPSVVYKRLPLFKDRPAAEQYQSMYREFCGLLTKAGVAVPESESVIVQLPGRPVVLYVAQARLPPGCFAHRLICTLSGEKIEHLLERVLAEVMKVWRFSQQNAPELEITVDGQLSNWAFGEELDSRLYYVDTSTPYMRIHGRHQLDPDLLLQATPAILRRPLERFFVDVDEIMSRYYDPRKNMIDLAANLIKEQMPELVPTAVRLINEQLPPGSAPVTRRCVERYYRQDKLIWSLFLLLRRVDRWVTTTLRRRRYEYMLPGRIKR
jgi:hypothetical protein